MKKLLFFASAALAMLSAASCQKEPVASVEGGNALVSLTVSLPEAPQTRAIAQAENADIVYFEVWNSDWTKKLPVQDKDGNPFNSAEVEGRKANIELTLVADQTYNFLFWAQNKDCGAYSWDQSKDGLGLKQVNIDYSKMAEDGNNDIYDAFYKKYQLKVNGAINETVVLYRPFAQLNFATERMTTSFGPVDLKSSKVTVTGLSTAFDLYNECGVEEDPANPVSVTFVPTTELVKIDEKLNTNGKDYTWLTMDYMLMQGISDLVEVEASFDLGMDVPVEHKIASVPLKKNYRTNIIGDVFAADAKLQIIIDQSFLKEDEDITVGVPEEIFDEDEDGVYNVEKPGHILWLSQESQKNVAAYAGKTISFAADIDMMGQGFLPINLNDVTILGNRHKVFNYKVKGDSWRVGAEGNSEAAGLFGTVKGTITDLHVKDVLVEGNWSAGALVGYIYGSVKNCSATNVVINSIPYASIVDGTFIYDDGNNVGGLIGYVGEGSYEITNNTVEGATITGYRCLGGLAGTVQYGVKVDDNTVNNTTITIDQAFVPYVKEPREADADEIVGRMISTDTVPADDLADNSFNNVTINNVKIAASVEDFENALKTRPTAIVLMPGVYEGSFSLSSETTIESYSETDKSVIKGRFECVNPNITFKNIKFDYNDVSTNEFSSAIKGNPDGHPAIVAVYGGDSNFAVFDNCEFVFKSGYNKDKAPGAISHYGGVKLVLNNCVLDGEGNPIYCKTNVEMTGCTVKMFGNNAVLSLNYEGSNHRVVFKNNILENKSTNGAKMYAMQFLSTNGKKYSNMYFDVQGNTGVDVYFSKGSGYTFPGVTYADGSEQL